MASCLQEFCEIDQRLGALYLAPCGTLVLGEDGKPVPLTTLDGWTRTETEDWNVTPEITVTKRRKYGSCGIQRCTAKVNDYNGSFGLCVCPTELLHCQFAFPETGPDAAPCEFEFVQFPFPMNCKMPDPLTDAYYTGGGIINAAPQSWDPNSDDAWVIQLTWEGCSQYLCKFNFCDQLDDGVVVDPQNCDEINAEINAAIQQGLAA